MLVLLCIKLGGIRLQIEYHKVKRNDRKDKMFHYQMINYSIAHNLLFSLQVGQTRHQNSVESGTSKTRRHNKGTIRKILDNEKQPNMKGDKPSCAKPTTRQ